MNWDVVAKLKFNKVNQETFIRTLEGIAPDQGSHPILISSGEGVGSLEPNYEFIQPTTNYSIKMDKIETMHEDVEGIDGEHEQEEADQPSEI